MKLLLDENLSPSPAQRLRQAGHDAVAVRDIGLGGVNDTLIRQCAMEQQHILVTLDADFGHILRFPPVGTPGVIWLQPWPPTEFAVTTLLDSALLQLAEIPVDGKLVIVEPGRIRLR